MDRLIRESKKLQRKSEQLNAGIEKLRGKIKKLQYNQPAPKKPRPRAQWCAVLAASEAALVAQDSQ